MSKSLTIIRYLIAIVIVLGVVGLLWWYFFLSTHTATTFSEDVARGFGANTPSFMGNTGSTYQNVAITSVNSRTVIEESVGTKTPPEMWHVSVNPTAGMGFVVQNTMTRLYFVERASGNIFSVNLQTGVIERITNTLMPKIYMASFVRDGSVIEQSIDTNGKITTFAGVVPTKKTSITATEATSSPGSLKGVYLDQNIVNLAVHPTAREIFYILNDPKVGGIGIRSAWDGSGQKRVFESGIVGWRPYWLSDGRIILAQNPAYNIGGYAYALESDGSLTPLIRNVPGLTILPRTSSQVFLYGTAADNTLTLHVQKVAGESLLLPIKTVTDKCVWAPGKKLIAYCAVPQKLGIGDFLINWLQGRIHTSDTWWKIDAESGTTEIFFTSENMIDVVRPVIDESGTYIAFMNGVDASLWVLRIPIENIATSTPR